MGVPVEVNDSGTGNQGLSVWLYIEIQVYRYWRQQVWSL